MPVPANKMSVSEAIKLMPEVSADRILGVAGAGDINVEDFRNKNLLTDALSLLGDKTPPNRLRTEFRDYAYWVPNLIADDEGNSYFTAKFPDNITQ